MTVTQWELTVRSKVDTSWNLHQLLPPSLDFFVQLSSLVGIIGTPAQSNYGAGSTFQDALARYRTSHGEKAISLDIGWMRGIGIVAETEAYKRHRRTVRNALEIHEAVLFALLDLYCDPALTDTSEFKSQLIIGIMTPAQRRALGLQPALHMQQPLFSGFSQPIDGTTVSSATDAKDDVEDFMKMFRQASTTKQRSEVVSRFLATKLAVALSISADDVDISRPLFEYGVDSLMAVELRNWIRSQFQATISTFDIMGGTSIRGLGGIVADRSEAVRDKQTPSLNGE